MNLSDVLIPENAVVVRPIAASETLADVTLQVLLAHAAGHPTSHEAVNFEPLQETNDGGNEDNYI